AGIETRADKPSGMGEAIAGRSGTAAAVIGEYEFKKEQARRTIESTNLKTKILLDREAFLDSEAQNPDYEGSAQRTQDFISKSRSTYLGMVKNDRDRKVYEAEIDHQLAETAIRAKNVADKKM